MPHIALLTDFGTRDPYVAGMKGVIASLCDAPIHDLTHDIAPFDVFGAAWFLRSAAAYWPDGTIFVCVVDPGVGTPRRILAARTAGRTFLAPDNGLLTFVTGGSIHSVENQSLFLPEGSRTFHGRDRFAPVAAFLADGFPLTELGPPITQIVRLPYQPPEYGAIVRGTVVGIDRFGNAITDIEPGRVPFPRFAMEVAGTMVDRVERTYGGAAAGPFLITGSSGTLEISVANDSAAAHLGIRTMQPVELRPIV